MKAKFLTAVVTVLLPLAVISGQPSLISADTGIESYAPGHRVDPDVEVFDAERRPVKLARLTDEAKVTVLILFGGAAKEVPQGPFRGRLWCEDSFDDLGVQRALVEHFREEPVKFVPVAVPPVYGPARFGFGDDVFLGEPEGSAAYQEAVRGFISATEVEREKTELPFDSVYYDPRARLLRRVDHPASGTEDTWEGMFKWRLDPRRYGTPTIWLLGPGGEVLADPFIGNDYDSSPPEINYGFTELKQAVERLLAR